MESDCKAPSQIPEYLELFSNVGDVTVEAKFTGKRDKGRSIASFKAEWHELDKLRDPASKRPYSSMCFDSYNCPIYKIEINPSRNLVVIHIANTGLPEAIRLMP